MAAMAIADLDGDVPEDATNTAMAPIPRPRRRRYQRGPLVIHPRRTFAFAGLGL
jgi:hypothetical protein